MKGKNMVSGNNNDNTNNVPAQVDKQMGIARPEELMAMANKLADFIKKKQLSVQISGKQYVLVEGWQFAGTFLGVIPMIVSVEDLSDGREIKYKAVAELIQNDRVVGRGWAYCSNSEPNKKTFQEYAIASTAQTRAIAKAYRNLLGWLIKAAGYEATPAEEMDEIENNQIRKAASVKTVKKAAVVKTRKANKAQLAAIRGQLKQLGKTEQDLNGLLKNKKLEDLSFDEANKLIKALDKKIEQMEELEKEGAEPIDYDNPVPNN